MLLVDMNGIQPSPVWWRTWIANQTVWIANQTAEIYAQRHTAAIEHWPWGDESQPLRDLRRDPHGEGTRIARHSRARPQGAWQGDTASRSELPVGRAAAGRQWHAAGGVAGGARHGGRRERLGGGKERLALVNRSKAQPAAAGPLLASPLVGYRVSERLSGERVPGSVVVSLRDVDGYYPLADGALSVTASPIHAASMQLSALHEQGQQRVKVRVR